MPYGLPEMTTANLLDTSAKLKEIEKECEQLRASHQELQISLENSFKSCNALLEDNTKKDNRIQELENETAQRLSIRKVSPQNSKKDTVSVEKELEALKIKEKELEVTFAKLVVAEDGSEFSFTCTTCLNIFRDAVTCTPCGHSYCRTCLEEAGTCRQCEEGEGSMPEFYVNSLLDDLSSRYVFRKQALKALKSLVQPSPAPGSLQSAMVNVQEAKE